MMKYAIVMAALVTGLGWYFTPPARHYPPDPSMPCRSLSMREFRGLRELQMARLDVEMAGAALRANDPARSDDEREYAQENLNGLRDAWHMWEELEPMRSCTHRQFEVSGF
jgi:hypothetical protein